MRGLGDVTLVLDDVERLKRKLVERFGSLVAAWRSIFDSQGSGRVSQAGFLATCEHLGLPVDADAAFNALFEGSERQQTRSNALHYRRFIPFRALDAEAAALISDFAKFIRQEFGTVKEAFAAHQPQLADTVPDLPRDCLDLRHFKRICLELGFISRDFSGLFDCIDINRTGYASLGEMKFLENWESCVQKSVGSSMKTKALEQVPEVNSEIICSIPPARQSEAELDYLLVEALRNKKPVILEQKTLVGYMCTLVEKKANPNDITYDKKRGVIDTPLLQAVERGTLQEVQRLLSCWADPSLANAFGRTPLHSAAARPRLLDNWVDQQQVDPSVLVLELISARAGLNAQSPNGSTPLHVACSMGHTRIIKVLCEAQADINVEDKRHRSPLFLSIVRRSIKSCSLLLHSLALLDAPAERTHANIGACLAYLVSAECPSKRDAGDLSDTWRLLAEGQHKKGTWRRPDMVSKGSFGGEVPLSRSETQQQELIKLLQDHLHNPEGNRHPKKPRKAYSDAQRKEASEFIKDVHGIMVNLADIASAFAPVFRRKFTTTFEVSKKVLVKFAISMQLDPEQVQNVFERMMSTIKNSVTPDLYGRLPRRDPELALYTCQSIADVALPQIESICEAIASGFRPSFAALASVQYKLCDMIYTLHQDVTSEIARMKDAVPPEPKIVVDQGRCVLRSKEVDPGNFSKAAQRLRHRGFTVRQLLQSCIDNRINASQTTGDVVREVIIQQTAERPASYMDSKKMGEPQKADRLVSHAWGSKFWSTVLNIVVDASGMSSFGLAKLLAERRRTLDLSLQASRPAFNVEPLWSLVIRNATKLAEELLETLEAAVLVKTYWLCIFAVDQHKVICGDCFDCHLETSEELKAKYCKCNGGTREKWNPCSCGSLKYKRGEEDYEVDKFDEVVEMMPNGILVSLDEEMSALKRVWVVAEIAKAMETTTVHITSACGLHESYVKLLSEIAFKHKESYARNGAPCQEIALLPSVVHCKCTDRKDKDMVFAKIQGPGGIGLEAFDQFMWCFTELCFGICWRLSGNLDEKALHALAQIQDLEMDFTWLKGPMWCSMDGMFASLIDLGYGKNCLRSLTGLRRLSVNFEGVHFSGSDTGIPDLASFLDDCKALPSLQILELNVSRTNLASDEKLAYAIKDMSLQAFSFKAEDCSKLKSVAKLITSTDYMSSLATQNWDVSGTQLPEKEVCHIIEKASRRNMPRAMTPLPTPATRLPHGSQLTARTPGSQPHRFQAPVSSAGNQLSVPTALTELPPGHRPPAPFPHGDQPPAPTPPAPTSPPAPTAPTPFLTHSSQTPTLLAPTPPTLASFAPLSTSSISPPAPTALTLPLSPPAPALMTLMPKAPVPLVPAPLAPTPPPAPKAPTPFAPSAGSSQTPAPPLASNSQLSTSLTTLAPSPHASQPPAPTPPAPTPPLVPTALTLFPPSAHSSQTPTLLAPTPPTLVSFAPLSTSSISSPAPTALTLPLSPPAPALVTLMPKAPAPLVPAPLAPTPPPAQKTGNQLLAPTPPAPTAPTPLPPSANSSQTPPAPPLVGNSQLSTFPKVPAPLSPTPLAPTPPPAPKAPTPLAPSGGSSSTSLTTPAPFPHGNQPLAPTPPAPTAPTPLGPTPPPAPKAPTPLAPSAGSSQTNPTDNSQQPFSKLASLIRDNQQGPPAPTPPPTSPTPKPPLAPSAGNSQTPAPPLVASSQIIPPTPSAPKPPPAPSIGNSQMPAPPLMANSHMMLPTPPSVPKTSPSPKPPPAPPTGNSQSPAPPPVANLQMVPPTSPAPKAPPVPSARNPLLP